MPSPCRACSRVARLRLRAGANGCTSRSERHLGRSHPPKQHRLRTCRSGGPGASERSRRSRCRTPAHVAGRGCPRSRERNSRGTRSAGPSPPRRASLPYLRRVPARREGPGRPSGCRSSRFNRLRSTLGCRLTGLRARLDALPGLIALRLAGWGCSGQSETVERRVDSRRLAHRPGADRRLDPRSKVTGFRAADAICRRKRLGDTALSHLGLLCQGVRRALVSISARCKPEGSSARHQEATRR